MRIYRGKRKKQQSKWIFLLLESGRHFSEPKKDDGVQRCGKGVPRRARGGNKTQQSKRELRTDIPRNEKETTIKMDFPSVGEWVPFLRAKER